MGVAVVAIPALLLAASCSALNGSNDSGGGSNSSGLEHPNLKVATAGLIDTAPFQFAVKNGYFKDEGLNVIPTAVASGSESLPKTSTGALDIGFSNWATVFLAQAKGTGDFRLVADGAESSPNSMVVNTYAGSSIKSLKDLVGKNVSTNSTDDLPILALHALMDANNLDFSKVNIQIVPLPEGTQRLKNHTIDAVLQLEPYKAQAAVTIGARPVADLFPANGPTADLPLDGYFTTAKFAQDNPKTVAAFARAMQRGAADAANRGSVEQILPTYTHIDAKTAALVTMPAFPTSLDAKRLQRVSDLLSHYDSNMGKTLNVTPMVIVTPPKS